MLIMLVLTIWILLRFWIDDVLNIRIDKDQNFNSYSDVVKIEVLEDGSIKYISLYHESKESSDSLS